MLLRPRSAVKARRDSQLPRPPYSLTTATTTTTTNATCALWKTRLGPHVRRSGIAGSTDPESWPALLQELQLRRHLCHLSLETMKNILVTLFSGTYYFPPPWMTHLAQRHYTLTWTRGLDALAESRDASCMNNPRGIGCFASETVQVWKVCKSLDLR